MSGVLKLLTDVGGIAGVDIPGNFIFWSGGPGDFVVWADKDTGDFGGGAVELQVTPNEGNNIICIDELTVSGIVRFTLNNGFKIRAVLADTTDPSSGVFAEVF